MIPIGDETPSRIIPIFNWLIIIACVGVFIWQTGGGVEFFRYTVNTYGLVPLDVLEGERTYSFVTYMFLHGGVVHLIGNMLFLFIFGDNIEDRLGHLKYLSFYVISGILASAIWVIAGQESNMPVVGASGAISAVMAAYLLMFPSAKVRTLITIGFMVWPVKVPAYIMIGLWIVLQIVNNFLNPSTGVAYLAHIGGFVVGFILAAILRTSRKG